MVLDVDEDEEEVEELGGRHGRPLDSSFTTGGSSDADEGGEEGPWRLRNRAAHTIRDLREPSRGGEGGRARSSGHRRRQHEAQGRGGGRPLRAYGWLRAARPVPGIYLPQVGDLVVYCAEGHIRFRQDLATPRYYDRGRSALPYPWEQLGARVVGLPSEVEAALQASEGTMPEAAAAAAAAAPAPVFRSFQRCRVVGMHFQLDSRRETCARMALRVEGVALPAEGGSEGQPHDAAIQGMEFQVLLPPAHLGHAEFLVLASDFDAALSRPWFREGERVSIRYVKNDLLAEGRCTEADNDVYWGWVTRVRRDGNPWDSVYIAWSPLGEEPDRLADTRLEPYSLRGNRSKGGLEAEAQDKSWHSPWELRPAPLPDDGDEQQQAAAAADAAAAAWPLITFALPVEVGRQLQGPVRHALDWALGQARFDTFQDPLDPSTSFETQGTRELVFYNSRVPLPFTLGDIRARLDGGYYRSVEAVLADVDLIADNARVFNGEEHRVSGPRAAALCREGAAHG